jgi:hypothetical protein
MSDSATVTVIACIGDRGGIETLHIVAMAARIMLLDE